MKKLCTVVFLCLFGFIIQTSDQKIAHGFITQWKQGSYGNFAGMRKNRPALPIHVWIQFDQPITADTEKKFFDFLMKSFKKVDGSVSYVAIQNNPGSYSVRVQASMTRELLQEYIDKANKYIDPEFKTPQEIAYLNMLNKKAEEAQKAASDQAESERIKAEQKAAEGRIDAEKARVQAEKIRKQAEVDKRESLKKAAELLSSTERNPIDTRNNFTILGLVPGQATMSDVKKAYLKLSSIHHPDRNKGSEELANENFKLISNARDNIKEYYENECSSDDARFKAQSVKKYKII